MNYHTVTSEVDDYIALRSFHHERYQHEGAYHGSPDQYSADRGGGHAADGQGRNLSDLCSGGHGDHAARGGYDRTLDDVRNDVAALLAEETERGGETQPVATAAPVEDAEKIIWDYLVSCISNACEYDLGTPPTSCRTAPYRCQTE